MKENYKFILWAQANKQTTHIDSRSSSGSQSICVGLFVCLCSENKCILLFPWKMECLSFHPCCCVHKFILSKTSWNLLSFCTSTCLTKEHLSDQPSEPRSILSSRCDWKFYVCFSNDNCWGEIVLYYLSKLNKKTFAVLSLSYRECDLFFKSNCASLITFGSTTGVVKVVN